MVFSFLFRKNPVIKSFSNLGYDIDDIISTISSNKVNFNKNNAASTFSKKLAYGTHLIISGITGFIVNGTKGSSIFVSATLADEILITEGYFQKHYLTSATFKGSLIYPITTNLITTFPNYSVPIYLTSTAAILSLTYYGTDFLNYQENLKEIQTNLTPNIRVIDPNILSNNFKNNSKNEIKDVTQGFYHISNNPIIRNMVITNVLDLIEACINSSFINYTGNDGNTLIALTLLIQDPNAAIGPLISQGAKISILWCGKNIISTLFQSYKTSLTQNTQDLIEQKALELLLNEEYKSKILRLKDIEAITNNLFNDLHNTFTIGILQLGNLTTQKIIQLIALQDIMNLVPGAIIFNEFENIKQGFLNILYQLDISYRKEAEKINENKASIVRNISSNTSNILLTDSAQFVQNQYAKQLKAKKEISKKMLFLDSTKNTVTTILDISDKFIKSLYYIYKVKNGEITLEQALLLNPWLETIKPFLTSSSLKIIFSGAVISQARITKLIEAISSEDKKGITWTTNDTNDELVISDYNLIIEERTILSFEKLVLKLGAHYLLSASSGKGKTTFLKSLVNCIADPCHSVGEISIPTHYQNPKIIFIDQNSYIPAQSTLFEVITSGLDESTIKSNKQSLEEKINTLFIKLDLATLITHLSDKNYDVINAPSGGQKKKIGIIKAIISNPKILILDEVFANLDKISIENAQQALKEFLPETLMLVVHHDGKSHDYNNFYDQCINFEDLYAEIKLLGE